MRKELIGVYLVLIIFIFSACSQSEEFNTSAKLLRVYTDLQEESGWWIVSKGISEMTISVEAENTDTVIFWIAPTGTETWSERTLIGYDKDGSDGWFLTWEFGDRTFHDRIFVQALGSDNSTQATETIKVMTAEP
ncbi:MAG: hypothetical protein MI740_17090 [Halanaerobiales bacterium]|nr:hypothetical protein [Halanaerobiales bacterium]